MYTHEKQYIKAGVPIEEAEYALILLHGRGGSAEQFVGITSELNADKLAVFAPKAANRSWYPYSFMADERMNQPALSSALETIDFVVEEIVRNGISRDHIFFIGFSQGACLALEYIAERACRYAGVVGFTGGLIGKELDLHKYNGDLECTPVLITTGNPDEHVPLSRVKETTSVLQRMNAIVTLEVFHNRRHTIFQKEFELANDLILNKW